MHQILPDNRLIQGLTTQILDSLALVRVCLPGQADFSLVDRLQQLPRTGKAVRIDRFGLGLPKQSLVDHIKTLSLLADTFQSALNSNVDECHIAHLVAFHDLAETITGDVPDFTSKDLAADHHATEEEKAARETMANRVIADSLPPMFKDDFILAIKTLDDPSLDETKFFLMLDKIEPIISVWRYLHQFRGTLDIDLFLEAMTDFFTNPKVAKAALTQDAIRLVTFFAG